MYKKILSIDYGTVRIGLAVSRATLAEPLCIIANDDKLFDSLKKVITDEAVEEIVVGLSENIMAEKTKTFVSELKKHTQLPISFFDETLSSHAVHLKLRSAKKSKREGHIDHFAAAEFLQEYLDSY